MATRKYDIFFLFFYYTDLQKPIVRTLTISHHGSRSYTGAADSMRQYEHALCLIYCTAQPENTRNKPLRRKWPGKPFLKQQKF